VADGVFVLGMHRGGTSAAARLVHLLGVPTCAAEDLMGPTVENPTGYWESRSLTACNDRLLEALGCDWSCPPALAPGWHLEPPAADLAEPARELFTGVMPAGQWVWKDPRLCVTLPFWLDCLEVSPAVVLVTRNPLEVADSLARRDRFGKPYALALWERSFRLALAAIEGLPLYVTDYGDVVADPVAWCRGAAGFLAGQGVRVGEPPERAVLDFVQPSLRGSAHTADDVLGDAAVSGPQRALFSALTGLAGVHGRLAPPPLPAESEPTEWLLAEARRMHGERRWYQNRFAELEARLAELS
jgi:hypothetical protein